MTANRDVPATGDGRQSWQPAISAPSRARILDVATTLFAERGFQATTIRDLAARAGVNIAAVNYHFRSKDELHALVVDTALSRWSAEIIVAEDLGRDSSLETVLRGIVEALIAPVFERPDSGVVIRLLAWSLLERPSTWRSGRVGAFAVVLAQLLDPHLPDRVSPDDSVLLAEWLVGQCLLVGVPPHAAANPHHVAAIVDRIVRLALHGLEGTLTFAGRT